MTDAVGSASPDAGAVAAAALAGNAGIPNATNSAAVAPNGSGNGAAADPLAGLETGIREGLGKHGIKDMSPESFGKVAKIAVSAESLIGKSVQLPGENAKPEDWDKVYNRLGRPEKADGYEFKLPDSVPKEMPYDGDFANGFKPVAHQLGLTAKQAAGVHDFYVGQAAGFFTKQNEKAAERLTTSTAELEKTWGKSGSETFKVNVDNAYRAVKGLDLEDDLKAAGLLGTLDGKTVITHPKIAKALSDIGSKLFREGEMVQGQGGAVTDNPFKDGPGKGNVTDQMVAIRKDRPAAIRAIRSAGHKPEDFGLTE